MCSRTALELALSEERRLARTVKSSGLVAGTMDASWGGRAVRDCRSVEKVVEEEEGRLEEGVGTGREASSLRTSRGKRRED